MKVERKEVKQFTPVVITLETREEFDFLYELIGIGRIGNEYGDSIEEINRLLQSDLCCVLHSLLNGTKEV